MAVWKNGLRGIGAGIYKDHNEAFASLKKLAVIDPDEANRSAYLEAYIWFYIIVLCY